MYLHLGRETVVKTSTVIGIFDIENTSVSKITREFLNSFSPTQVVNVSEDLPKSFVVAKENEKTVIYISPISVSTLKKRGNLQKL